MLILVHAGPAAADDEPPPGYKFSDTLVLTKLAPGKLEIRASEGLTVVPVDQIQQSFESLEEFAMVLNAELGAVPYFDPSTGELLGVTLETIEYGDGAVATDEGSLVTHQHLLGAVVGGSDGLISIGGVDHCVNPDICGPAGAQNPVSRAASLASVRQSNGFSIAGSSNKFDLGFFREFNSGTRQVTGGYQELWAVCSRRVWFFRVYWPCWRSTGTNSLFAEGQIFDSATGQRLDVIGEVLSNTRSVTARLSQWGFMVNYPPGVGTTEPGYVFRYGNTICGSHSGSGTGGSATAASRFGHASWLCHGGGGGIAY